jgi:hypothetical protein
MEDKKTISVKYANEICCIINKVLDETSKFQHRYDYRVKDGFIEIGYQYSWGEFSPCNVYIDIENVAYCSGVVGDWKTPNVNGEVQITEGNVSEIVKKICPWVWEYLQ